MADLINGVNGVSQPNGVPQINGLTPETNGESLTKRSSSYSVKFNLADHFIGGNRLEAAPPSDVKEFVKHNDGHTVITNVNKEPHNLDICVLISVV